MQSTLPAILDGITGSHVDQLCLTLDTTPTSFAILAAGARAAIFRAPAISDPDRLANDALSAAEIGWSALAASIDAPATVDVTITIDPNAGSISVEFAEQWHWTKTYALLATDEIVQSSDEDSLGIGLFLVRRMMDEVDYFPQPGNNRWRTLKRLRGTPADDTVAQIARARLRLPASYRYLNVLGECIGAMLPEDVETANALQLAAHEICTNIIDHAYAGSDGQIEVTLTHDRQLGTFLVETRDFGGNTFDLSLIPDRFDPTAPAMRSPLLTGSALLFVSATLVNAGNYLFNLLLGRWLGPAVFADLSLMVTLFLVISFITAGLQTPAARFGALYAADHDLQGLADVRRWSQRRATWIGLGLMLLLVLGAPLWTSFFSTASSLPFVIFGIFLPFYILQGVDRGLLQGRTRFGWLAVTYQTEMWSRLAISIVLVALGFGINGAVMGIGLSFVAAWFVAQRIGKDLPQAQPLAREVGKEIMLFTGPVLVAQLGQILINNSDILIVRRFFVAEEAGAYAALALIGRMVFFATWSIVTAMFPIVAQRFHRGEAHRPLYYLSLGIVLAGSLAIIGVTALFPEQIVILLFGDAYIAIAPLLWVYAMATMFYALANVVINYRLSIGSTGGTYLAITTGAAQVLALWMWHDSLAQIVWIQVGLMGVLFVVLLVWDWVSHFMSTRRAPESLPTARASQA
jgi:O-antigen/teichoic acid export membrane protein/anti-sigma regulatory factor (Ser/Thr protein kinase)